MDLKFFPIKIKGEQFKVAVADNDELRYQGLSNLKRLGKRKGMLFMFPEPIQAVMEMRDMNFGLDFLFLDKDWEIIQLGSLDSDPKNFIEAVQPSAMVLELPQGTIEELGLTLDMRIEPDSELKTHFKGVKKYKHGGSFELIGDKVYEVKVDDIPVDPNSLQVLNDKGEVVANIKPGSRIFSRVHTKDLINKYKKGDKIGLAKAMLKILDIQDNQDPEYVSK